MKEAMLYSSNGRTTVCALCAHRCSLQDGQSGVCGVRKNIGGVLRSLNYDKICATHADPIEKKPLYHFLPGSSSFSIAAMGCNFKCRFCQNHTLSIVSGERGIYGEQISPEQLVRLAMREHCASISYTYSEPTVFFELMLETAQRAKDAGLKNVMVSNGFISGEGLEALAPFLDAANIDLKSFSDDFYRSLCGGRLAPVLETIQNMNRLGIWLEVTTLLIPGLNDGENELAQLASFLAETDKRIPWHVSRFYPQYRLQDRPPTPAESIFRALETGKDAGLLYVYAGNLPNGEYAHTACPHCKTILIERWGYRIRVESPGGGKCPACGLVVDGVF